MTDLEADIEQRSYTKKKANPSAGYLRCVLDAGPCGLNEP